jgi:hypothetical protein
MRYVITGDRMIMMVVRGFSYTIHTDHPRYDKIREMIQDPDVNESILIEYTDFEEACGEYGVSVSERNNNVYVDGKWDEKAEDALEEGVSLGNIALRKALEGIDL